MLRHTIATLALLGTAASADAGLITFTGEGGIVDNDILTRTLFIDEADLAGVLDGIFDVDLTVDFSKCSGQVDPDGCVSGASHTYNSEIAFFLEHFGTGVRIVSANTFSGQTGNADAVQTYDDGASGAVGGSRLVDGRFRPVGSLSAFNGLSALGTWDFSFSDDGGGDPLVVRSWKLNLTLADADPAAVPEPSSLALLGLGLVGMGAGARRARARRVDAAA